MTFPKATAIEAVPILTTGPSFVIMRLLARSSRDLSAMVSYRFRVPSRDTTQTSHESRSPFEPPAPLPDRCRSPCCSVDSSPRPLPLDFCTFRTPITHPLAKVSHVPGSGIRVRVSLASDSRQDVLSLGDPLACIEIMSASSAGMYDCMMHSAVSLLLYTNDNDATARKLLLPETLRGVV